jgi:UDP-glucose 4-epimerase
MILVVGGAGYIGSHMVKTLRDAEEAHVVFDSFEKGHRQALQGSPWVEGDLRNPDDVRRVFDRFPTIDVVMHFAAYILVGESVHQPAKYYRNNTAGVLNLVDSMQETGVDKLVFSSTAAVFGEPVYVPIVEDHPKSPTSPYGWSKWMVEQILNDCEQSHQLRSVCLRYFNAAGADPDGILGEDHDPESHLIPLAIQAALQTRPALTVFGQDYDTPDGTCVRDYIHILDLAKAHLLAVRHLRQGGESRRYNLGNGEGFSVKEVLQSVERVSGHAVPHTIGPRRAGDPSTLVAASNKIRDDWGWKPQYPELDTIVAHAWRWFESHPQGYRTASPEPV